MTEKAPIAVFLYNRPDHARRILKCLETDPAVAASQVTIYCDGPKREEHRSAVQETRSVAQTHAPSGARIVERDENYGLARSIITGVTEQCDTYGRVIVLEDDLRLSPAAIDYFNAALDHFSDDERVMHVAGYMYPVEADLPEMFLYREASCWGWATWQRAWAQFEPDARKLLTHLRRSGRQNEFDIGGSYDYEHMLYSQWRGKIDSWAIRWYASVFLNDGLCLHPGKSLVANHGFDGTGVHFKKPATSEKFHVEPDCDLPSRFPEQIVEHQSAVTAMMSYRGQWRSKRRKKRLWKRMFSNLHYRLKIPF